MGTEEAVEALLSAYGSEAKLAELVRFSMERNLAEIATGDDLREIVVKLVDYYQRHGEIWKLIASAALANPKNADLSALMLRGPLTQLRRTGGGSPMDGRRSYSNGEGEEFLMELTKQISRIETTIARWEEASKWQLAANERRIEAIERDVSANQARNATLNTEIDAINQWRSAVHGDLALLRDMVNAHAERADAPRSLALPPRFKAVIFVLVTLIGTLTVLAGALVYILARGV